MMARLAKAPAVVAVAVRSIGSGKNTVIRRTITKRSVHGQALSCNSTRRDVIVELSATVAAAQVRRQRGTVRKQVRVTSSTAISTDCVDK